MGFLFCIFIFLFGVSIGSFLNVLIDRLPQEKAIGGRSHCPKCGQTLAWYDLIPVLSFLLLRGRCRYCKKPISIQYPLVELTTGILFLAVFWHLSPFGRSPVGGEFEIWDFIGHWSLVIGHLVYWFFIVSCLIVIFVYDLRHYIIPDKIIYPAIIVSILYGLYKVLISFFLRHAELVSASQEILKQVQDDRPGAWGIWQSFFVYFLSALAAAAFFLALVLITRGQGMGLGDAKLAFLMGLILGWPNVVWAIFFAFFAGAMVGLTLVILNKKTLKSQIPFGPFLAAATVFTLFLGDKIINWYSKLLL